MPGSQGHAPYGRLRSPAAADPLGCAAVVRTRLLFAGIFALFCIPVLGFQADAVTVETLAVQNLVKRLEAPSSARWLDLAWAMEGDEEGEAREDALRSALRLQSEVPILRRSDDIFRIPFTGTEGGGVLRLSVVKEKDAGTVAFYDSDGNLYSLSRFEPQPAQRVLGSRRALIPPLLAILLAFMVRNTLLSLFAGVLAGGLLLAQAGGNPFSFLSIVFGDILIDGILNNPEQGDFYRHILGFVLFLSALVAVLTRMGGVAGMVDSLRKFARSRRGAKGAAFGMGFVVFFDDYANTVLVGNSCGPLFDKLKISRAKLAYIVDSTAAPIAGVALMSTWVAYQISTFAPQLPTVGMAESEGYALFLQTIPYRFYCWFALMTVGLVILLKRDFGPMCKVEEAARYDVDHTSLDVETSPEGRIEAAPWAPARWFNGVIPLVTMLGSTALLLWYSGVSALSGQEFSVQEILGASDSSWAIFYGTLSGLVVAMTLAVAQRILSPLETLLTATRGLKTLFKDGVLILLLAWSIGAVCDRLGTADYLVAVFQDLLHPYWLPVILFLTSCFVAFATGSSWSTMAIMQPNVVLLAWSLGDGTPIGSEGLLILSIGSVLEGAIFGDHCSPISDTTILSSAASRCRHIDHVRTQIPYALLAAGGALFLGYIPAIFLDLSPLISLGGGAALLAAFLLVFGRNSRRLVKVPA